MDKFLTQLITISDEDYAEQTPKLVENLISRTLEEKGLNTRGIERDSVKLNIPKTPEMGSIEYILNSNESYRLMSFEETFKTERGVEYNQDAVMDYAVKESKLSFFIEVHNTNETIKDILKDATTLVDGNNKYGVRPEAAEAGERSLGCSCSS